MRGEVGHHGGRGIQRAVDAAEVVDDAGPKHCRFDPGHITTSAGHRAGMSVMVVIPPRYRTAPGLSTPRPPCVPAFPKPVQTIAFLNSTPSCGPTPRGLLGVGFLADGVLMPYSPHPPAFGVGILRCVMLDRIMDVPLQP
jgi:hypothetical protein